MRESGGARSPQLAARVERVAEPCVELRVPMARHRHAHREEQRPLQHPQCAAVDEREPCDLSGDQSGVLSRQEARRGSLTGHEATADPPTPKPRAVEAHLVLRECRFGEYIKR